MSTTEDTTACGRIIEALEQAANTADPDKAEAVMWLDDERFSEIEDHIAVPFGAETVREIHQWARKNLQPGDNIRFRDVNVRQLSDTTIYATAIEQINMGPKPSSSRVTFLFLKKDDRWGLIHAHYSGMPSDE